MNKLKELQYIINNYYDINLIITDPSRFSRNLK